MDSTVKLLALLSYGALTVVSSACVTLTAVVTLLRVYASAFLPTGAICARIAVNVDVTAAATPSTATALVKRAGGVPPAPRCASATPAPPDVTLPQATASATKTTGVRSAAFAATAIYHHACNTQASVSV